MVGQLEHDMYILNILVIFPQIIASYFAAYGNILAFEELQSI